MTMTADKSRALIEAIVVAPTIDALRAIRRDVQREYGLGIHGSFIELLIELRRDRLERPEKTATRIA